MKRYKGGAIVRRPKTTRYISIILMFCFTGTSSYAAVGLQTTPIRALADDLEVGGADKWWLHQMVTKAEKLDNRPEIKVSAADGYHAGVASGEIDNDTRAVLWGLSTLKPRAWMSGQFRLLGIAGTSSKASKELRSIAAQTEGQKYVYNSAKDGAENVKEKRSNQRRIFIIFVAGVAALFLIPLLAKLGGTGGAVCAPC